MTVGELINELRKYETDLEVVTEKTDYDTDLGETNSVDPAAYIRNGITEYCVVISDLGGNIVRR